MSKMKITWMTCMIVASAIMLYTVFVNVNYLEITAIALMGFSIILQIISYIREKNKK